MLEFHDCWAQHVLFVMALTWVVLQLAPPLKGEEQEESKPWYWRKK